MEFGETDLRSFLQSNRKDLSLDMNYISLLWQQMLQSVNTIHKANIIHSDLKPANFLFVRGSLKLIDFGIARTIAPESTSIQIHSAMGTLNYISPESLSEINKGKDKAVRVVVICSVDCRYEGPVISGP